MLVAKDGRPVFTHAAPEPPTVWHNGGSPGVGGGLDMNPGLDYTVAVLSNRDPQHVPPVVDVILNALRIP